MSRIVNVLGAECEGCGMGIVIVEGRECAMREDGLRGYSSRKGPKPVMRTLSSSAESALESPMLEVEMLDSVYVFESVLGVGERGGCGGEGDGMGYRITGQVDNL